MESITDKNKTAKRNLAIQLNCNFQDWWRKKEGHILVNDELNTLHFRYSFPIAASKFYISPSHR